MIIVDVNQNRNNSFRIHSQTLKLCNYRMKERIQLTKLIKEKIRKIDKRDRKNYDHYAITLAVDEDKTEEEEKVQNVEHCQPPPPRRPTRFHPGERQQECTSPQPFTPTQHCTLSSV